MPLDIEIKHDSNEKLAAIAGKPTENYLFAEDVNKIVEAFNNLEENVEGLSNDKQDKLYENNLGLIVNALNTKDDIQDSFKFNFTDTSDANKQKKTSWLNIKAKIVAVIDNLFVPKTRTITIGGVTQDLSVNRTFSGGSLPKTELYKRHYEAFDNTSGYTFLGGFSNAAIQESNRGAFDYGLTAWPYNTPNTVGGVAYTIFHNTLNIPTQFSETNLTKIKGFYSLISFKLTNYASTSQRFLFGPKRDTVAFSNINPSAMGDCLFSVGRDSGDANFSFFIKPDSGAILKIDTGIAYNIQETITLEVERPSGGVSGYMKITTSETRAAFTYNISNMKNLWAINNGGGINNAASTDIVGYYIFVNKMYKEL